MEERILWRGPDVASCEATLPSVYCPPEPTTLSHSPLLLHAASAAASGQIAAYQFATAACKQREC